MVLNCPFELECLAAGGKALYKTNMVPAWAEPSCVLGSTRKLTVVLSKSPKRVRRNTRVGPRPVGYDIEDPGFGVHVETRYMIRGVGKREIPLFLRSPIKRVFCTFLPRGCR